LENLVDFNKGKKIWGGLLHYNIFAMMLVNHRKNKEKFTAKQNHFARKQNQLTAKQYQLTQKQNEPRQNRVTSWQNKLTAK